MIIRHDKPKRWRPRFSVRTLPIVVTLVSVYFGCWVPTRSRGVADAVRYALRPGEVRVSGMPSTGVLYIPEGNAAATLPLLVVFDKIDFGVIVRRRYYFWFFGYVAKLPFETSLQP